MDLMTLFPRKLFNDAVPQIVLKHQLYSIHDKTMVDKEVVRGFLQLLVCSNCVTIKGVLPKSDALESGLKAFFLDVN